jgi:hypothetical protein
MVYKELFCGSYNEIKIKAPGEYTEIILVDEELPDDHYRKTVTLRVLSKRWKSATITRESPSPLKRFAESHFRC